MENIDFINQILAQQDIFYKIVLIIFMLLYSLFALMLYIQINSLIKVVNQIAFSPIFRFIALMNIVASILIIGYTILTISL
ncbi:MAG TPA: hypothetical protein PLD54_01240 [Candidatus Levybacteria bacterium]|nr:hypothetical protein [Candidatus Levybacteria bacterium]